MAELSMAGAGASGTIGATQKYGAVELKAVYQKYWMRGLMIAVAIHALIVGSYYLAQVLAEDEPPPITVRILKYSDLGPPPSMNQTNTPPPVSVSAPVAKPTVGAPVPVPDAEASPEQTLATQTEMSQVAAPIGESSTEGGDVQIEQDIQIEDDGPPADFVPVEKMPEIVRRVEPKYPELAIRAGLEGKVFVKIWVDKEGKVKQVVVQKSDAEIFNEAAVEAAKQFVFTPAYMNNGPVAVWVSVPFKFKLADRK
ncbi:MAG: energy transducer TonB [Ignavibacteriae bacterium]|nr:energy transducer TonB [Ignavibacteriota bacterium]